MFASPLIAICLLALETYPKNRGQFPFKNNGTSLLVFFTANKKEETFFAFQLLMLR